MLNRLKAGAANCSCNGFLAQTDALHRTEIYTSLGYERLKRKYDYIRTIYKTSGENWNQTFFTLLLRFLGAPNNSEAFTTLAARVGYGAILRYGKSVRTIEALLIGGSGLLEAYPNDEYTLDLKREFAYLSHKHSIEPMSPSDWKTANIYPHNHPVIRMAQAAAFLAQRDFVMDNIIECRTPKDVAQLFGVGASDYWVEHFVPSLQSSSVVKRIGFFKSNILAINVVAQLQYAYGSYIGSDRLRDRAITLLETVPPEDNVKVRKWTAGGVSTKNAFETQALIQLTDEYCRRQRCEECPIGRRIIKSAAACL